MRGVYAIVDLDALALASLDWLETARAILSAGPCAVQLRAKALDTSERIARAGVLAPLCRAARVPLFMNDDVAAAVASGCDGVHVGQGDIAVEEVRARAPGLAVGVSTHTLEQLVEALSRRPTYVAYGPVFATASKRDHEPVVGLEGLADAWQRTSRVHVPLVAIGGIDEARARAVAPFADCVAVIGALLPPLGAAPRVAAQVACLAAALDEGCVAMGAEA